jgi:hypothetical protein
MLKSEVRTPTQRFPVSFFDDDTIQTVRQKIGSVTDIHPDRLFILVAVKYSRNYYTSDPRHWEALFERLSLNGMPIEKEMFDSYTSSYRIPALNIPYEKIEKEEWMAKPDWLEPIFDPKGDFTEYRILGVEERKSFCLPLKFSKITTRIPAVSYPIPDNARLFSSFYKQFSGFLVQPFEEGSEGPYFPLLQSVTPSRLTTSQLEKLDADTKHLTDLLALDPPTPTSVHILKTVWFAQLVDSDFGVQIRNRFEQIFYGLTVSEDIPCISFFTGRNEMSRHKFYTDNVRTKKPKIDMPMWQSWWSSSKPPRNRPTLVLYRGSSRDNYDRISISATDMAFACYRDISNTQSVDDLKNQIDEWFKTLDSITPFIEPSDVASSRWVLQEIQYEAKYEKPLEELDTRRLNCVTGIFDELRSHKTVFRLLRTDYAFDGLTSTDLRILDMIKDTPYLTPNDIERETRIPLADATRLLAEMRTRIEEDPSILTKAFRGFPLYKFTSNSIIATYVYDVDRSLKYLNILNYILSNPKSKELDAVCPKRVEAVEPIVSTVNVSYEPLDTDFANLFDYIEEKEDEKPAEQQVKQNTRVNKKNTKYGYLLDRLETFDPDTFESYAELKYPKACEQIHQPVVLSKTELNEILDEYNPQKNLPEEKRLDVSDPDGTYICPEYWCMYDKIPLQQTQLIKFDGVDACPVCKGKVRNIKDAKSDTREFSVIKRDKKFAFPKYSNLVAPKNLKSLPCCFQTPTRKEKKLISDDGGKYYIMRDNASGLDGFRLSFLSQTILGSLHIDEDYDLINKSNGRIQTGVSAFFRVGLGRPSETLPIFFGIDKEILRPKRAVKWVLKTTFLTTWTGTADPKPEIDEQLKQIQPFKNDDLARENVNRIISSIDQAYKEKTLSKLQELEYCALVLGIDIFKIDLADESMTCTFYTRQVVEKSRGLVVLYKNEDVDCLCHVVRTQRKFEYRANVFDSPFQDNTHNELIKLREQACHTNVPSFKEALAVVSEFLPDVFANFQFSVILDPFGRAQAIYGENNFIIPFKNTAIPERDTQIYINGYADIKDTLPEYETMRILLDKASKEYSGYAVETDIYNGDSVVELLLASGLRVPIKPFKQSGENDELFNTITKEGETELVFGKQNEDDQTTYRSISYASELFEFLIFQLSKDIDEYPEIRTALSRLKPVKRELEPPLQEWFDKTTMFHQVDQPLEFLSKIRAPCGQMKSKNVCENSHMCGWDGKCKIAVRNTFSKTKLFNKLLGTLLENPKTRYSILDGLTTPFFSTILYLELPNEIILSDYQLKLEKSN